jgi:GNAT superfamily N-acetyltransferase
VTSIDAPMTADAAFSLRQLASPGERELDRLAELLIDCVDGGASVGFMHPLPFEHARAYWQRIAEGVAAGERALLVAEDAEGIAGTVQLVLGMPDNQPHRADLSKMLVHRRARRRGVGSALMRAAEALAREHGKALLVLDTASGSEAERLYRRLGWQFVGQVPGFALLPRGGLTATSIYYRHLVG